MAPGPVPCRPEAPCKTSWRWAARSAGKQAHWPTDGHISVPRAFCKRRQPLGGSPKQVPLVTPPALSTRADSTAAVLMAAMHAVGLTAPVAGCASQRRQQPQPTAAPRAASLRCQAAGSILEAASSSSSATELGRQAAERMASGAAAGPRPSTTGVASSPAASGSSLRSLRGSRPINLGPGGVLTSDLIARATGSSGLTDEGYHPINR